MIRFPDQKFGVVILCNLDTFNPLSLAEKIADLYLAAVLAPVEASESEKETEPDEGIKSEPLAPEQLTEFEGDYYTEELDTTYTIGVRGDGLVAQHRRHEDIVANLRRRSFPWRFLVFSRDSFYPRRYRTRYRI